ncbi:porin family protein [Ferruginibacter sp. SUN002]|uniref:porin family protein n=1 Tax=Ferruginibacter sp. SUN002 TaxID=2937789 RepID=UPI003D3680C7
MKFYLNVAIAAILMTGQANAQHVNIGIKGGLNLYNINNSNGLKYDMKAGAHIGLMGHIHLNKMLAFQPELVYSMQGAKYTTGGMDTKINLGYVNVPLLVQYMFDNGFRLEAGPQVGYLVSANTKRDGIKSDIKDDLNGIDFALGLGVGYVHPSTGFGVDARYNLGLNNINDNSTVKSMNRGLQVGVFYLFNHK